MDDSTHVLMKDHSRAIMHMRAQKKLKRFGLVFGAGICRDFGFPQWDELIRRIALDKRVEGEKLMSEAKSKSSVSQLLFQSYRIKELLSLREDFDQRDRLFSYLQAGWNKVVHDALYKDVPIKISDLKQKNIYIHEYLDIIKNTRLTVNYNFDDTLQVLLSEGRSPEEKSETRGFRTVWSADLQLYPQDGVIYHPNGYLPRNFRERPSDEVIFLEDAFGDQLLESVSGHYMTLSYHFSQNTCLFIGLSLNDSTLKHLLRKSTTIHPGHVHYYVYFMEDGEVLDEEHRRTIRDANFTVHNLVTLFLNREGLRALGRMLKMSDEEIGIIAEDARVQTAYRFFLTGSVSVGKSTSVSHFRSLLTYDEWLDQKEAGMDIDPSKITDPETIRRIDKWIAQQWRLKNFSLSKRPNHGVHIIDRCPLDAFAFTPEDEWIAKARLTRENVTPYRDETPLCKGKVILMIGDPEVMAVRALKVQKDVTAEKLEYRQNLLRVVYNKSLPGIAEIDTREKSIRRVVKDICRVVHIEDYEECDLQAILDQIEAGKIRPSGLAETKSKKEVSKYE